MIRFTTSFLLRATAVTALCCAPISLDRANGFVWTAFLLPVSWAILLATQVEMQGEYEIEITEQPNSVVEIAATGGRYNQWATRVRIVLAGFFLSPLTLFPALNYVDPEPIAIWLPVALCCAGVAIVVLGVHSRNTLLVDQRLFVTSYLLLGRLRLWRRRWQVLEGDYLAVFTTNQAKATAAPELQFWEALFVCRSRRRLLLVDMTTRDRTTLGMETAARRLAELVNLPYEGYRDVKELGSFD